MNEIPEPYSSDELIQIFKNRLSFIEDTELSIKSLGLYAIYNHLRYNIFAEAIFGCFNDSAGDLCKQLAYIHLLNEIVQKESAENVQVFLPFIERMMIKAAETKDAAHIMKAKHVLAVLADRRVLDPKYVDRIYSLMDYHRESGADEDSVVSDNMHMLTTKLIRAKMARKKIEEDKNAPVARVVEAAEKEKMIRNEMTEFYTKQINRQYSMIEELDKKIGKKQDQSDDLLNSESDSSSDNNLLL